MSKESGLTTTGQGCWSFGEVVDLYPGETRAETVGGCRSKLRGIGRTVWQKATWSWGDIALAC